MVLVVQELTEQVTGNDQRVDEGELHKFSLNHPFYHVIVYNPVAVLRPVDQAMGTGLVDQARGSGSETKDLIQRTIGEDVSIGTGVRHVPFHILAGLCSVQMD